MNYAVLEIPNFPLFARARLEPPQERPTAIYAGTGRRSVIAHLNQPALARGLRLGMSGIQALGECPGILLWQRDETAEAEATALLLNAAWRLSPRAEVSGPGLCTVALDGRDLAALKLDTVSLPPGQGTAAQVRRASQPLMRHGWVAPPTLRFGVTIRPGRRA